MTEAALAGRLFVIDELMAHRCPKGFPDERDQGDKFVKR
jgi:hypothetical protein